jgi:hypothetical protein
MAGFTMCRMRGTTRGTKNNGWRQIVGQPADAVNP